ncbi:hypothetical protein THAOC_14730, partial [Thalassiosira oceanica]
MAVAVGAVDDVTCISTNSTTNQTYSDQLLPEGSLLRVGRAPPVQKGRAQQNTNRRSKADDGPPRNANEHDYPVDEPSSRPCRPIREFADNPPYLVVTTDRPDGKTLLRRTTFGPRSSLHISGAAIKCSGKHPRGCESADDLLLYTTSAADTLVLQSGIERDYLPGNTSK